MTSPFFISYSIKYANKVTIFRQYKYDPMVGIFRPKFEMVALSLHEGNPGHHLQTTHLLEMEGLPAFRRFLEDRQYGIMPSRFTFHTAYIEGWGLYSERLGDDLHLYNDPYMKYVIFSFLRKLHSLHSGYQIQNAGQLPYFAKLSGWVLLLKLSSHSV